ncbi:MAG: hypothetical protein QXW56_06015 [Nitrososphaerota archaeon]
MPGLRVCGRHYREIVEVFSNLMASLRQPPPAVQPLPQAPLGAGAEPPARAPAAPGTRAPLPTEEVRALLLAEIDLQLSEKGWANVRHIARKLGIPQGIARRLAQEVAKERGWEFHAPTRYTIHVRLPVLGEMKEQGRSGSGG